MRAAAWRRPLLGGHQPPVVRLAAFEAFDLDFRRRALADRGDLPLAERRAVSRDAGHDFGVGREPFDDRAEGLLCIAPRDDLVTHEADRIAGAEAVLLVVTRGGRDRADLHLRE